MEKESYLATVRNGKERQGKRHLIAYLEGKLLSPQQAIRARCYDCMGFYDDGKVDCESETCPLHPYMPYNPNRRKIAGIGNPEALAKARAARAEQDTEDIDDEDEADDREEQSA